MKEDGFLDDMVKQRYASWDEGFGKSIEEGKENFKTIEPKVLDMSQSELRASTQSDHLEEIKDTINHYIIETLAK
ncbi:MAG TPA: xylose isomerase, partial [Candidatus Limosilactobacillus merdigallinarum]|nr:xylose isomerase [Candidatus Limosilactobacillus merdigallinarum]